MVPDRCPKCKRLWEAAAADARASVEAATYSVARDVIAIDATAVNAAVAAYHAHRATHEKDADDTAEAAVAASLSPSDALRWDEGLP